MRDPYRKKQRDLRRAARSTQRPYVYQLFDVYHPEYKQYYDSSDPCAWSIHWNAQWAWVRQIAGSVGWADEGGVPSWYRRSRNRKLRTRQKGVLSRAFREEDWDDFVLPIGRHDVGWLWW